jgi:hypothetical protein
MVRFPLAWRGRLKRKVQTREAITQNLVEHLYWQGSWHDDVHVARRLYRYEIANFRSTPIGAILLKALEALTRRWYPAQFHELPPCPACLLLSALLCTLQVHIWIIDEQSFRFSRPIECIISRHQCQGGHPECLAIGVDH